MKIVFHTIRAKNFLQIGNEFETFPLDRNPFTVIVGRNGSGKSTLLDAITYVLYKKPYRPKIKLGQLINDTNKKGMLVEIAFSVGTHSYVVRRGEKPKVFEVYKDKKLLEPDATVGDMQAVLEQEILNQNFKTFCQINALSKVTYTPFMELEAKDRRTVVENILDSNIYSVMQTIAKADLKNLNEDVANIERDVQIVESNISSTKAIIKQYSEDRSALVDQLKEEALELLENRKKLTQKLADAREALDKKREELKSNYPEKLIDRLQDEISNTQGKIGEHRAIINQTNGIISKIDTMELCPHCLQDVDDNHKQNILTENKDKHDTAVSEQEKLMIVLEKYKNKYQEYQVAKSEIQSDINDVSRIELLLSNAEQSLESKKQAIIKASAKQEMPDILDIDSLEDKLKGLNQERDQLIIKQTKLKDAIKLLGDDGIKAHLINKYIPIINSKINEYLEKMNMFVEFTIDSEFNESINAINRQSFTYFSFSEGQKMRIDLAILLTWRYIAQVRNSMTTNLFILDEIADGSLDEEGMNEFVSILKEVSDAQNTFIISHKDSTIDLFDNVIKVETDGNFSKYSTE